MRAGVRKWSGYLLMLVGFLGLVSLKVIFHAGAGIAVTILLGCLVGGAAALIGLSGRHLAITGRKQLAGMAARTAAEDPRPPVLYLRSFADDAVVENANVVEGFIQLTTEEEQFAKVLTRIGPFIAIGDPREKLPILGATRLYVGDGDWKKNVEDLLRRARLVVVRLSATRGLLWELGQVIATIEPKRVLVFVPRVKNYEALRRAGERWFPRPLPAQPKQRTMIGSLQGIVRFGPDWTPEFIPARFAPMRMSLRSPIAPHLQLMLRPVFQQLGTPWSKPRLGVFPVLLLMMVGWTALFFLLR